MAVETTDIKLQADRSGDLDDTGDWETVTGNEYVKQRIVQAILNSGAEPSGGPVTATAITEIETRIIEFLQSEPYANEPIRVDFTEIDGDSATVEIRTASDEFDFSL